MEPHRLFVASRMEQFMNDPTLPPPLPLPYARAYRGSVVGYSGKFGPGRQSLLIGCVTGSIHLCLLLFWIYSPDKIRFTAAIFVGPMIISIVIYAVELPFFIFGVVRASTAMRLGIEPSARMAGGIVNLMGIAGWLCPILRFLWHR